MHSNTTDLGNTYHHGSNLTGEVKFRARIVTDVHEQREARNQCPITDGVPAKNYPDDGQRYIDVSIPGEDMKQLVMDFLRSEAIDKLEQMSTEELMRMALDGRLPE